MDNECRYVKKLWPTEYINNVTYDFEVMKYNINTTEQRILKLLSLVISVNDLENIIKEYLTKNIKGNFDYADYSTSPYINIRRRINIYYKNSTYFCMYCQDPRLSDPNYYYFGISGYDNVWYMLPYENFVCNAYDKIKIAINNEEELEIFHDMINIFHLHFEDVIKKLKIKEKDKQNKAKQIRKKS